MDIVFNCSKCGVELEVDASGVGEEINCPKCNTKLRIPEASAPGVSTVAGDGAADAPRWGGPAVNPIASSAAAKVEKHLKVPVHSKPTDVLIAKPPVPLEVAAKTSDLHLRIKTIRHLDCVEVGHDRFDEMVTKFLDKIGEHNFISMEPISYSHVDIATQKLLDDYGVLIVYKG
jgi:DNA-directed RNA polymerase subunit RPC12/RpoP